jgi:serine/threonine-protein phosphatase 6 regulatory ankyrin repeat subunit B
MKPSRTRLLLYGVIVTLVLIAGGRNLYQRRQRAELFRALEQKNLAGVQAALARGANPNGRSRNGTPALSVAVRMGQNEAALMLIKAGAEVQQRDAYGQTALQYALLSGSPQVVRELILRGGDPRTTYDSRTPLSFFARTGERDMVQRLLDQGVAPDATGYDSPLSEAAAGNHIAIIDLLLARGASINYRNGMKPSALVYAVRENAAQAAERLLQKGIDVNATFSKTGFVGAGGNGYMRVTHNHTALSEAIEVTGNREMVRLLLQYGANPNLAVTRSSRAIGRPIKADGIVWDGVTPLMMAARNGRTDILRLLIARGALLNVRNREGLTARDLAARRNQTAAVSLLRAPVSHPPERSL